MNETNVTVRGNLVADPERISSAKGDFTTFRIAVNEFHRDQANGGFVDGRSSFYKVVAYRGLGTNAHTSLSKGTPVLIHGILRINQWQTANGEPRSAPEIEAVNLGPDLRFGIATYQRVAPARTGPQQGSWRAEQAPAPVDPWVSDDRAPDAAAPSGGVTPSGGAVPSGGATSSDRPSEQPGAVREASCTGPLIEQRAG